MGICKGITWLAMEGSGVGVHRRLVRLVLRSSGWSANAQVSLSNQFMNSADKAVSRVGPLWARKEIQGRAIGVWLLVLCWLAPPTLLALTATYHRNVEHHFLPHILQWSTRQSLQNR